MRGLATELGQVHSELLSQLTIVSFKEYAREKMSSLGRINTRAGQRQFMFLLELGGHTVALDALLSGSHRLARFYSNVTARTIYRDVALLESLDLIVVEDGIIRAKSEVMDQFTAPQFEGDLILDVGVEGDDRQPRML